MKAALFDMGGVLLRLRASRTFETWSKYSKTPVDDLRSRWLIDDAYKSFEVGASGFGDFTGALSRRLQIELTQAEWLDGWNAIFDGVYDGILERSRELARSLPCFVFTNTNPEHEKIWAARHASDLDHFEKIYVSSTIGVRKPGIDAYQAVLSDMGFDATDVIFFDDNRDNVAGANDALLTSFHVTSVEATERRLDELILEHRQ